MEQKVKYVFSHSEWRFFKRATPQERIRFMVNSGVMPRAYARVMPNRKRNIKTGNSLKIKYIVNYIRPSWNVKKI